MARIAKKQGDYHHGNLRRVLLDTAVKVIEKEGLAAVSLHALTKRAGVSSGAPYHHFASREELLTAVALEGFELLVEEMRRSVQGCEQNPAANLEGLGRAYMRFALTHRGHFRVMFRAELREHLGKGSGGVVDQALVQLQRAIVRCQDAGLVPPGDPRALVLLAWSAVHGACDLWIDGSLSEDQLVHSADELIDSVASTFVRLLTGGLRA
jgi:AcrR family transcriptional regulator